MGTLATFAYSNTATPGLSGSIDYSDFELVKDPLVRGILGVINNMTFPRFDFPGGYFNDNRVFVTQTTNQLVWTPIEEENAMVFQISDIKLDIWSKDFNYKLLAVPIQGFLNIKVTDVFLKLKLTVRKVTGKEGRILP